MGVIHKIEVYLNLILRFASFSGDVFSSLLFQMWSVLLKLEGKSIVQQSVFMYCSRSCKTSNWGNKCDEEFDGWCLRCKTTCTHFPRKRSDSAWLMQSTLTLQKISERKRRWLLLFTFWLIITANKSVALICIHVKISKTKMRFKVGLDMFVGMWLWD